MQDKIPYFQYAIDVVEGRITTNEYVKLSCRRFLSMIEDDRYFFNEKKVANVIKFIESLKLSKDQFAGKKFKLQPWQKFLICGIYGVYDKETKRRVTRKAYIEVSRKSGKTALLAALSLYELLRGGKGAEVYCLAASRDQAHILFDETQNYAKGLDPKEQYIKQLRQEIRLPITNSKCKVLSADASRLDGVNCSFFVVDEIEVQPNDRLYSVLATSQGMRQQPLAICIGSGGNDTNSFGYKMRQTCIEIIQEVKDDPSQFALIYCLDSKKEVEDENMWIKACPNLNVTVQKEFLREQLLSAKNNNSLENYVMSRQFGIWTTVSETWIDDSICVAQSRPFDPHQFFKDYGVYVGVDLAAVSDLTAVAYLCVLDGYYHFYVDYYLPTDSVNQNAYYEIWAKNGHLKLTPGNATDYSYVTEDIMKMRQAGVIIKSVHYDRYLSPQWAAEMTEKNFKMSVFSQTLGSFSAPTKEFERLLRNGKIVLHQNPITRWCISNVTLKEDHMGNVKPVKGNGQKNKIDGVIAVIEALGGYMTDKRQTPEFSIVA